MLILTRQDARESPSVEVGSRPGEGDVPGPTASSGPPEWPVITTRGYALLVTWVDAGKLKKAEFAVAASRFSPGWNPENATARDSFLAQVTGRLPKS